MLATINITVLLTSVNTMLLLYSCCTCWFTVTVVRLLFGNGRAGLGIRNDGIAAITAMITVHCTQRNLHPAKSRLRVDISD